MTTIRETDQRLSQMAARLRLSLMRDNMGTLLDTATESKMTPREALEYFFQNCGNRSQLKKMNWGVAWTSNLC